MAFSLELFITALVNSIYAAEMMGFEVFDGEFKPSFKPDIDPSLKYIGAPSESKVMEAFFFAFGMHLLFNQLTAFWVAFGGVSAKTQGEIIQFLIRPCSLPPHSSLSTAAFGQSRAYECVFVMIILVCHGSKDTGATGVWDGLQHKIAWFLNLAFAFMNFWGIRNKEYPTLPSLNLNRGMPGLYNILCYAIALFYVIDMSILNDGYAKFGAAASTSAGSASYAVLSFTMFAQVVWLIDIILAYEYCSNKELATFSLLNVLRFCGQLAFMHVHPLGKVFDAGEIQQLTMLAGGLAVFGFIAFVSPQAEAAAAGKKKK